MDVLSGPAVSSRSGRLRWRLAVYWVFTAGVVAELGVGGAWDVTGVTSVRDLVAHLGYPSYFLTLLGIWKMLGAVALLIPGRALLKEWVYAGAIFTYTGAVFSHVTTGYALAEVPVLTVLIAVTVASWALRPASRRTGPTAIEKPSQ